MGVRIENGTRTVDGRRGKSAVLRGKRETAGLRLVLGSVGRLGRVVGATALVGRRSVANVVERAQRLSSESETRAAWGLPRLVVKTQDPDFEPPSAA